ncbi:MAG: hypothetical protein K1X55_13590 [Chitinophagales bacterium]|nr:hypothetical protein [Chitinophagales bacterium]
MNKRASLINNVGFWGIAKYLNDVELLNILMVKISAFVYELGRAFLFIDGQHCLEYKTQSLSERRYLSQ